jgi:transcriptional regulator
MYVPTIFAEDDPAELTSLMRAASFAALVTTVDGRPAATHLPLVLDQDSGTPGRLLGHVARANDHWKSFDGTNEALAIFSGPHAYISPSWYESANMVPTWNYAAVHVYGRPRVIEDTDAVLALLARLVGTYESDATGNWSMDKSDSEIMRGMTKGIVAFEMPIERMEGKWKMSQNRKPVDARGAIEGLRGLGDAEAIAVAEIMEARIADH